jgi:paraquat-inducible protein B
MSEPQATISSGRRFPVIWLVPIVALVLGIWMVVYTAMSEGPEIRITFSTAEGIEAGKTKLKTLNVEVGVVEEVMINDDLASVTVVAKLDPKAETLLRDDTRFWVVRPRIGAGGVSGLGTLLSGGYIEVEAGDGAPSDKREYAGLDDLPPTPVGTPGIGITLVSSQAGSLGAGDPILYRGYEVGRVEEVHFDPEQGEVRYRGFIEAPFDSLVDRATRFWNVSGISVTAGAEGVRVDVGTIQSILSGGVAFDVPKGIRRLGPASDDAEFDLYEGYDSTLEEKFDYALEVVVEFTQSVRGLLPGAPVEYRGLRVGSVRYVMLDVFRELADGDSGSSIPVLIALEPGRLRFEDSEAGIVEFREELERNVANGLFASLQSGNLITGALYVGFEYFPDEAPGEIEEVDGYPVLPSLGAGLDRITHQLSSVLTKIDRLPIEGTLNELNGSLRALRKMMASQDFEHLPETLNATMAQATAALESFSSDSPLYVRLERAMDELNRTLQSVESLSDTLNKQPNSLIFSTPQRPDPEPGGDR